MGEGFAPSKPPSYVHVPVPESSKGICVICQSGSSSYALCPCGHMCLCEVCVDHYKGNQTKSSQNQTCPVFRRGNSSSTLDLYLSFEKFSALRTLTKAKLKSPKKIN